GLFEHGIVNFHGGVLPRYRGVNIANHVILEGATEGGATLHLVDSGIDTGPIIDRDTFQISDTDTAYDVFRRTQETLMELFRRNITGLLEGTFKTVNQNSFVERGERPSLYKKGDEQPFRNLNLS